MGKNNSAHIIITLKARRTSAAALGGGVCEKHQVLLLEKLRLLSSMLVWNGGQSSQFGNRKEPSRPFVEGGFDSREGVVLAVVGGWERLYIYNKKNKKM